MRKKKRKKSKLRPGPDGYTEEQLRALNNLHDEKLNPRLERIADYRERKQKSIDFQEDRTSRLRYDNQFGESMSTTPRGIGKAWTFEQRKNYAIKKQREEYLDDKQYNVSSRTKRLRNMPIDRRPPNWCKELYEKVKEEQKK